MSPSQPSREAALRRLIRRLEAARHRGEAASRRLSWWRLAIFVAGAACTVLPYRLAWYHTGNLALALFALTFLVVARYHSRLEERLQRLQRWLTIKQRQLARLRLDWACLPEARPVAARTRHDSHPYARDLDVLSSSPSGSSLLRLLDTTISSEGRARLTDWLLGEDGTGAGTSRSAWRERQQLVRELAALPLLRDRLQLAATVSDEDDIETTRIRQLLTTPVGFPHLRTVLVLEGVLAATTLGLGVASLLTGLPGYWSLSFTLYVSLYFLTLGKASPAFPRAVTLHQEIDRLGAVFRYLEDRSYPPEGALHRVCAPLITGEQRPSLAVHRLARVAQALSIRAHPLVHLAVNALVPWDLFFTDRLERLRVRTAEALPIWLETLAVLEAAAALGNLRYLNPDYVWPVILTSSSGNGEAAGLVATQLGHPMLPSGSRITNDLDLRGRGRMLLLTGSNMSGKSTFLRTVGINVCLAQAGGPVCASSFQWSPVRLFCCVRVDDSLEAGLSFFYAEVKRLKRLLDAAQERAAPPVLFLIDEIFKGTNNRERLLGSQAFIRALGNSNGFGLITTHDLELAELEREIRTATNAHFQETVEDGALRFDYRLRPGPCPTTNALRIMELEGLPVPKSAG